ncbi:MAG: hypothetical protein ABFC98_05080 [Candidatus Cloacimonas sp.]
MLISNVWEASRDALINYLAKCLLTKQRYLRNYQCSARKVAATFQCTAMYYCPYGK